MLSATEPTLEGRGVLAVSRQIRSLISVCVLVNSMHSYFSQLVIHWERRVGPGNTRSPPEVPDLLWAVLGPTCWECSLLVYLSGSGVSLLRFLVSRCTWR